MSKDTRPRSAALSRQLAEKFTERNSFQQCDCLMLFQTLSSYRAFLNKMADLKTSCMQLPKCNISTKLKTEMKTNPKTVQYPNIEQVMSQVCCTLTAQNELQFIITWPTMASNGRSYSVNNMLYKGNVLISCFLKIHMLFQKIYQCTQDSQQSHLWLAFSWIQMD